MIEGGADPIFIAGALHPCLGGCRPGRSQAMVQTAAAAQITHLIGLPEALFPLAKRRSTWPEPPSPTW